MSDNEQQAEKSVSADVNAVGIKLPTFWTHSPDLWFNRAEGQFRLKKITTQLTMFDHVLAVLTEDIMRTVRKAAGSPNEETAYDDLKDALIARHKPHRVSAMLAFEASPPVGPGQDPTHVADTIEGFKITDLEVEIFMFLSKMPDLIKHDLIRDADEFEDIQDLARAAKKLMGKASGEVVSAISGRGFRQTGRQPRRQDQRLQQQQSICFAHQKYGDKATTCRDWCTWKNKKGLMAIDMEPSGNYNLFQ